MAGIILYILIFIFNLMCCRRKKLKYFLFLYTYKNYQVLIISIIKHEKNLLVLAKEKSVLLLN